MKRFTGWVLQRVLLAGLLAAASSTCIAKPSLAVGDDVTSEVAMICSTVEAMNLFSYHLGLPVPRTPEEIKYTGSCQMEPENLHYKILAIIHINGYGLALARTLIDGAGPDAYDHIGWLWLKALHKAKKPWPSRPFG